MSRDPLSIGNPAGLGMGSYSHNALLLSRNHYAYIDGKVTDAVDPDGLQTTPLDACYKCIGAIKTAIQMCGPIPSGKWPDGPTAWVACITQVYVNAGVNPVTCVNSCATVGGAAWEAFKEAYKKLYGTEPEKPAVTEEPTVDPSSHSGFTPPDDWKPWDMGQDKKGDCCYKYHCVPKCEDKSSEFITFFQSKCGSASSIIWQGPRDKPNFACFLMGLQNAGPCDWSTLFHK
jgi:hypothetical protein